MSCHKKGREHFCESDVDMCLYISWGEYLGVECLNHMKVCAKLFLATLGHMEFLGQGSGLSHSFDHSCGSARPLAHWAGPGFKPTSQPSQDDANPFMPHGNSQIFLV